MSAAFPLTPALSLGEREQRSQRLGETNAEFCSVTGYFKGAANGCSFSQREKVRMRGNAPLFFTGYSFIETALRSAYAVFLAASIFASNSSRSVVSVVPQWLPT